MEVIKLMLADDHTVVREALKHLLESEGGFQVIAEAGDGVECLERIAEHRPDLLILDLTMPQKNGFEVLEELNKNFDRTFRILILTGHKELECLLKAIEIGVDGFILKSSGFEELKKAIEMVIHGEVYIQPNLIPKFERKMADYVLDTDKLESLTRRELDVLKHVAVGMYNKEIAMKLEISERTVKNHVSNIFKKIGVADRTQAAVFAIRNCLVDVNE